MSKRVVFFVATMVFTAKLMAAYTNVNGINWQYYTSAGKAVISKTTISGDVTIPQKLDNYVVSGIGAYAFYNCTNLRTVKIPESVKSIGADAFALCSSLNSVTLSDGLISIGKEAFRESGLTNIVLTSSVKEIGEQAFYRSFSLKTATIGSGVTNIGVRAFSDCVNLNRVYMQPANGRIIGMQAFYGCKYLSYLAIGKGTVEIGYEAFKGCATPSSVTMPASVKKIESGAFRDCTSLTRVIIENGDAIVAADAFDGCTRIVEATLPGTAQLSLPQLNTLTISAGSSSIAQFTGCLNLTEVTMPNSVRTIGDNAFRGCTKLSKVSMSSGLTRIGDYAFYKCTGLKSLYLGSQIIDIGSYAFASCTNLKSINLPETLKTIGEHAFDDCESLQKVSIGRLLESGWFEISYGSASSNPLFYATEMTFWGSDNIEHYVGTYYGDLVLPDNVSHINDFSFVGFNSLTNITMPDSVSGIGKYAFWHTSLKSVTIPSAVASIGESAFAYSDLTNITFKGDAPMIGPSAFDNMGKNCVVYVPDNATGFGENGTWQGMTVVRYKIKSFGPSIDGDEKAVVEGDAENGYTIKPSEGKTDVIVLIPEGVDAEKVTVEVSLMVNTVNAGGADIKIEVIGNGGNNITEYLDIPAADANGTIDMTKVAVKESITREVFDTTKEEVNIDLTPSNPSIETANTRPGLKYTFVEGRTIEELAPTEQYKWGDGTPFKPTPSVTGGKSAFYTVTVEK